MTRMRCRSLVYAVLASAVGSVQAAGQAESPANPDWAKFHSTADAYALLDGWAAT